MIRDARAADVPNIISLMRAHHSEQRFSFDFDAELIGKDIANCLASTDWICLVAERSVLVATAYRPPFVPVRVGVEIFLRCESAGVRQKMLVHFEEWARSKGCTQSALASTYAFKAFGRLYRPAGYEPAEMTFAKEL